MSRIELQPELPGENITLRPLREADFDELYLAASDPLVWEQHPDFARYRREVFEERYFRGAIASGGALAVVHNQSARVIGSSRYYEWDPAQREIAIGYTFIERAQWGNGTNREMKTLMLGHIFQYADTVWFHVADSNLRSRRAMEKLGATLSHSEGRELDGRPFEQLFYRLRRATWEPPG